MASASASQTAAQSVADLLKEISKYQSAGGQAKQLISSNNAIRHAPPAINGAALNAIIKVVEAGYRMKHFKIGNSTITSTGEFILQELQALAEHLPIQTDGSSFINGADKTGEVVLQELVKHPNGVDASKDMIDKFKENAKKYEDNRQRSARTQLQNDGVPDDLIDKLVSNSDALREFIRNRRDLLKHRLKSIFQHSSNTNSSGLVTSKDKTLYEKHSKAGNQFQWFDPNDDFEDNYYPNDGAVPYLLMLLDLVSSIKDFQWPSSSKAATDVGLVVKAAHSLLLSDSINRVVRKIQTSTSLRIAGVEMAKFLKAYFLDPDRSMPPSLSGDQKKLAHPLYRTPLRFLRMASGFFGLSGGFSVANLPAKALVAAAMDLYKHEKEVARLVKKSDKCSEGAQDFFVSLSVLWSAVLGQSSYLQCLHGRNDLSAPVMLQAALGGTLKGFGNLRARDWAIVSGLKHGGKPVQKVNASSAAVPISATPPNPPVADTAGSSEP